MIELVGELMQRSPGTTQRGDRQVCLANIASGQNSLTFDSVLGTLGASAPRIHVELLKLSHRLRAHGAAMPARTVDETVRPGAIHRESSLYSANKSTLRATEKCGSIKKECLNRIVPSLSQAMRAEL